MHPSSRLLLQYLARTQQENELEQPGEMSDWKENHAYDKIGMLTAEERAYYSRQSQEEAPDDENMSLTGPTPPVGFHFIYTVHKPTLESHPALHHRFITMSYDEATHTFVTECLEQYRNRYRSPSFFIYCCIKPFLSKFYAHTDLNGILHTGQMFLISTKQIEYILNPNVVLEQIKKQLPSSSNLASYTPHDPPTSTPTSTSRRRLLDVGAGDGRVTAQVAPLFDEIVCTEVSSKMCTRLKKRGYRVHNIGDLRHLPSDGGYDVITLFNVIDRCNTPITLLKQIRGLLRSDDSRVLLATPLPLNPWVEKGLEWAIPAQNIRRSQAFKNRSYSFEESCGWLVDDLISRCGFVVQSVSKIPYISQGDNSRAFYLLHDALFVLAPVPISKTNDTVEL